MKFPLWMIYFTDVSMDDTSIDVIYNHMLY